MSFNSGIFPEVLKTGKVLPVFKKGDPLSVDNYRPVTISSSISKIFEYSFIDRLQPFLTKFNVIPESQHGFVRNKSTITALTCFYEKIVKFVEAGECPIGIFCDLSRAFDCIDHKKMIHRLVRTLECLAVR